MTESNKVRLLRLIAATEPVENPKELVVPLGNGLGLHSIVHLIWSLQKSGWITFKEKALRGGNGTKIPMDIRLTPKGRQHLERQA